MKNFFPIFREMELAGLVLASTVRASGAEVLMREAAFLPEVEMIVLRFPSLKVVVEHVSSKDTVDFLKTMPETVGATVTVHHLLLTLDDLIGSGINPHNFCKPVVKTKKDREALLDAVLTGNRRYFFGSDSAPHPRTAKEQPGGAAGIYSSPVAIPLLAELFADSGALDRLNDFSGRFGAEFYRLPLNDDVLTLTDDPWTVAEELHSVVPLYAGRTLRFKGRFLNTFPASF